MAWWPNTPAEDAVVTSATTGRKGDGPGDTACSSSSGSGADLPKSIATNSARSWWKARPVSTGTAAVAHPADESESGLGSNSPGPKHPPSSSSSSEDQNQQQRQQQIPSGQQRPQPIELVEVEPVHVVAASMGVLSAGEWQDIPCSMPRALNNYCYIDLRGGAAQPAGELFQQGISAWPAPCALHGSSVYVMYAQLPL